MRVIIPSSNNPNGGDSSIILTPSLEQTMAVDKFIQARSKQLDSKSIGKYDDQYRGEVVAHYALHGVESPAYKRMLAVSRTIEVVRSMPTAKEMDRLLRDYNRNVEQLPRMTQPCSLKELLTDYEF